MTRSSRPLLTCLSVAALFIFLFHGTGVGLKLLFIPTQALELHSR